MGLKIRWRAWGLTAVCAIGAGCVVSPALAGPTGGTVVGGQATITNLNRETLIKQLSNKAIINWNAYSVQRGQSVIYQQPGANSIALNRVLGGQPSSILGHIGANGQVWLINPNGVLFGKGATVNAAGVLATTADIANSDFMAGKFNFGTASANANAGIVNYGSITAATGGSVVLAAPTVDNEGLIQARLGTVAVGAGKTFAVDFNGDNLLTFAVTAPSTNAQIKNSGKLSADGGTIQITARAAGNIVDNVINTTGIVQADSVSIHNGTVVLDGGGGGVTVAGTVSAAGKAPGTAGGSVEVLGNNVTLTRTASVDVSGRNGGGTALVGGNFHGAGPQGNAETVTIAPGAVIDADALAVGNGGRVAVWSSKQTIFNGKITARGGRNGGNGGLVETSSTGALVVGGFVSTLAPHGAVGDWLLDPSNVNVSDVVVENSGGTVTPAAIDSAETNVTLQATNNITFTDAVSMSNNGVGLIADAGNSIVVNAPITTKGGLIALSANDPNESPTGNGIIQLNAALDTANNNQTGGNVLLTLNGGVGPLSLGADIATASGTITLSGPTKLTGNVNLATTAGGIGADVNFAGSLDDSSSFQHSLTIAAGAGNVGFHGRVGIDKVGIGIDPGAVTITSANDVTLDMPLNQQNGGDAFAAKSLDVTANGSFTVTKGYLNTAHADGSAGDITIDVGGNVTIARNIIAAGGVSNAGVGGNGGAVTITAGGAVSIFGCCNLGQLGTTGTGTDQIANIIGIDTNGYSIASAGQTAGNGGKISVTGASVALPLGAAAHGGEAVATGATANGGNGANITLTATGAVTIGDPANNGNLAGLYTQGGNATGGTGGAGGNVTVAANTIALSTIFAAGGNSKASSGGTGNSGGNITLIATANSGAAITLFGEADPATDAIPSLATLDTAGGRFGSTGTSTTLLRGGTITGKAGNITIEGSAQGAPLAGASFVQLATGTNSALEGGSNILLSVSGGPGHGGTLNVLGPIEATTADVENLRIVGGNGTATIAGPVGDQVALNEVVLGCCGADESGNPLANGLPSGSVGGAFTFDGAVSAASVIDQRFAGSLTIGGLVTTADFDQAQGNGGFLNATDTSLLGGAQFSGPLNLSKGSLNLAGDFVFTENFSGQLKINHPTTLAGDTILDATALNDPLLISAAVEGATAGGQSLTVLTGTGSITISGDIGATTALRGLTLNGGPITASGPINVGTFILQNGTWSQVDASLPSFQATNFELQGGSFLRALGGNGTVDHPYQLDDVYGLQGVGTLLSDSFILARNIDASGTAGWNGGAGFIPIGGGETAFTGSLDGASHSVSGLTIDSSAANVGLFGTNSGTISNLSIAGATVISTGADANAGLLAGTNTGAIGNTSATGSLVGASSDGGDANLGGLVGYNNRGTINGGSFANATVVDNPDYGDDSLGGLVGRNNGVIFQADTSSTVVGSSNGAIFNGWGGLVGAQDGDGSITQSFASGSVTNLSNAEPNMGGLVGIENGGTIADSFASGPVVSLAAGGGIYIGGLVGWQTGGGITRSYSVGLVQCPNNGCSQGGLIGVSGGTVDGLSFWDMQTAGQTVSAGGAGLTTAQAQSASYLAGLGWSFTESSPWRITNGGTYPFLQWAGPRTLTEIVSGTAPQGDTVNLLVNGALFGQTTAAPNGAYNFVLPANTSGGVLVYLPGGSIDAVSQLTASGASGLALTNANTVTLLSQGGNIATSLLATAVGNAAGPGILYGTGSNTIFLGTGVALNIVGSTVFVDNAIAASGAVAVNAGALAIGANIAATGFTANAPVQLTNSAVISGGTGGVTFASTVNTGANDLTVIGDSISLGGAWSGTGTRTLYPFTAGSAVTLAPTLVAPATFNLTVAELGDLDSGPLVTIGSSGAPATGPLTTGDFTFNSPLRLIGSSITLDPLSKNGGTLTAISGGAVNGGVNLGAGTGNLFLTAYSSALTGTVNGASGAQAAQFIVLVAPLGPGPFTTNGVADGSQQPPPPPPPPPTPSSPQQNSSQPGPAQTVTRVSNAATVQDNQFGSNPAYGPAALVGSNQSNGTFDSSYSGDSESPGTVSDIDSGAAIFVAISPNTPTDLKASSSNASGTETILLAAANPPPVRPANNAEVPKPQVTRFVAPYLNQMLSPNVPRGGVPGISFGYSLTGNSALW